VLDVRILHHDVLEGCENALRSRKVRSGRKLNVDAHLAGILVGHELELENAFRSLRTLRRFVHSVLVAEETEEREDQTERECVERNSSASVGAENVYYP